MSSTREPDGYVIKAGQARAILGIPSSDSLYRLDGVLRPEIKVSPGGLRLRLYRASDLERFLAGRSAEAIAIASVRAQSVADQAADEIFALGAVRRKRDGK